jgi:hypothetical protein
MAVETRDGDKSETQWESDKSDFFFHIRSDDFIAA